MFYEIETEVARKLDYSYYISIIILIRKGNYITNGTMVDTQ